MDTSVLVVLGLSATIFFLAGAVLQRLGLLEDDPPVLHGGCEACARRRDITRAWD